ncbi:restriction endonuclease subunit S [Limosilactobacillus reuteri]|uniref:restriction endonuclease subunit S n=1 Tax=Limosilactobacillus reuteri TaxID=1598 RepID=UPI003D044EE7
MSKDKKRLVPVRRFKEFENADAWEQRKLGEVATFSKGTGYSKQSLESAGTPIILYGRMYTNYELVIHSVNTFTTAKEKSIYSNGGEVIVPASGETAEDISVASVVEQANVLLGGDLNIIHTNKNVEPVFLSLSITNGEPHKDMAKRAQGKSVVHLHNSDLAQIKLSYPSKDEQKQIDSYFLKLDSLIALHQRKLDKLKRVKSAYLTEMFPAEGEREPKRRFPGFTGAWEQHKLSKLITEIGTGKSKYKAQDNGRYPILGSTSVIGYDNNFDYTGDFILTARVGANAGKLYQFSGSVKITDNTVFIKSKHNKFLYYYLQKYDLKKLSFGTGQPLVKASELKNLKILKPRLDEEIYRISKLLLSVDNLITLHQRKLDKLQKLKNAYLNEMFV